MARTKSTAETQRQNEESRICTNSRLWLEAYVDESVDRGDNCHPGTITRFGMLIIFLRFFHNFPALKAIRFLIKVYQVVLQPVQRQSLREFMCSWTAQMSGCHIVQSLLDYRHPKLDKLMSQQEGVDLVTDLATSSAISWSSTYGVSKADLIRRFCAATTLVAFYLPSRDMVEALHLVVASLHVHNTYLVSKVPLAVVHQLIVKRSENNQNPVSVKAEETAVVALYLSLERNPDGTLKPLTVLQMEQLILATSQPFLQAKVALAWVRLCCRKKSVKDAVFGLAMQAQGVFEDQWNAFLADTCNHYQVAVMALMEASNEVVERIPYTANFQPDRSTPADFPSREMYRSRFIAHLWEIDTDESSVESLGGFRPKYGKKTLPVKAVSRSNSPMPRSNSPVSRSSSPVLRNNSPVAGSSEMQQPQTSKATAAEKTPRQRVSSLKATPLGRPSKKAPKQTKKKSAAAKRKIPFSSDESAAADSDSDAQPTAEKRQANTSCTAHLRDGVKSGVEPHVLTGLLKIIKEQESASMDGGARKRPPSAEKPILILARLPAKEIIVPESMKPRVVLKRLSDAEIERMLQSSPQPLSPQLPDDPSTPTGPLVPLPAAAATALVGPVVPSSNSNLLATRQSARLKARKQSAVVSAGQSVPSSNVSTPAEPLGPLTVSLPQVPAQVAQQPQPSTPPAAVLQVPPQKIIVVADVHHAPSTKKTAAKRKAQPDVIGSKKAATVAAAPAAPATPIVAPPTDGALQQPRITRARKSGILSQSQRKLIHEHSYGLDEIPRPQNAEDKESVENSPAVTKASSGIIAFCKQKLFSWFGFGTSQVKDDDVVETNAADKEKVEEEEFDENSIEGSSAEVNDHSSDGDEEQDSDASAGSQVSDLWSKGGLADQPFGVITDDDDEFNGFLSEDDEDLIEVIQLDDSSSENEAAPSGGNSRPSRSRTRRLPNARRRPASSSSADVSQPDTCTTSKVQSRKRIFTVSSDSDVVQQAETPSAPKRRRTSGPDNTAASVRSQRPKRKVSGSSNVAGTSSLKRQRASDDLSDADEPELSKRRTTTMEIILQMTKKLRAKFAGRDTPPPN